MKKQIHFKFLITAGAKCMLRYRTDKKTFVGQYIFEDDILDVFGITEKQYQKIFEQTFFPAHVKSLIRKYISSKENYQLSNQELIIDGQIDFILINLDTNTKVRGLSI